MPVKPILPYEVSAAKLQTLPDAVIASFNELIYSHFSNGTACFKQSEVVDLMVQKGLDKDQIFDNHWLDVENIYMANGWIVEYDSPAYNESYEPTFTFKVKKKV